MKKLLPVFLIFTVIIISGAEWMLIHEAYSSLENENLTEVRFTEKSFIWGKLTSTPAGMQNLK